jgi:hypothetical protein
VAGNLGRRRLKVSPEHAVFRTDANDWSPSPATQHSVVTFPQALLSRVIAVAYSEGASGEMMEAVAFTALSQDSFAEDWDNPDDAIYNAL